MTKQRHEVANDKPVTIGIVKVKRRLVRVPLSLAHSIVFPAVSDVIVMLSCEV